MYSSGATFPELSGTTLKKIKITIPPLSDQDRIADILSAYDDLIENNNRRIELLEKAAQEIYKEWFVRMRFPGHGHSDKGIPYGWKTKKLKDICEIDPKISLKKNQEYAFINIAQINPSQGIVMESEKCIYNGQSCSKFSNGDTLLSRITPCLENRKIAMAVLLQSETGFGSTEFFVFRGKPSLDNNNYIHQLVSSDVIVLPAINSMTGASGRQRADKKFISNIKITYPTQDLIKRFEEISNNINREIIILLKKNRNLIKQRDLLLPRLMSGKLEV